MAYTENNTCMHEITRNCKYAFAYDQRNVECARFIGHKFYKKYEKIKNMN